MTDQLRTCPGPSHACMGAPILLAGIARHNTLIPCVRCGAHVSMARYVPDALPDRPGHLCPACDPAWPGRGPRPIRRGPR